MGSNLINNYIAARQIPQKHAEKKPKPDFDIQHELDNKTFIKPLRGRGRLVNGGIFSSPQYLVSNIVYNMKAISHAAKGKANDHELGKLNDIGLMGGGIGIASYLATKRFTPMTKGMEFVGFGAFLASMALWPKIAIQLPAYLIHGVNVRKEYRDSFGRKKPFYQDPQFIPWDLYTDEQIQKIGDRMGVDKNIPNRRDFIQEKMRKLAVQNNTLWMLTAGFATPIMTALTCEALKPLMEKKSNDITNKKADKIMANIEDYSNKHQQKYIKKSLQSVISGAKDKPVDQKLIKSIYEIFTQDIDPVASEGLKKDLKNILSSDEYSINENTVQNIRKNIISILEEKNYSKDLLSKIIPNESEITELFKDKNLIKTTTTDKFLEIKRAIVIEISKRAMQNGDSSQLARKIRADLLSLKSNDNPIIKELQNSNNCVLDSARIGKLMDFAEILDNFVANQASLDEYALLKVGSAPETVIANYWNDVSKDLLKNLGITDKELEKLRFDRNLMGKILRDKIEKIASDDKSYKKFMNFLVEKVATLNSQIKSSDMTSHLLKGDSGNPDKTTYEKAVDSIFDKFAQKLREKDLHNTADALVGKFGDEFGTAKAIQKAYVEERLLGVKCSFYRLINTLDFYRRVADNPNQFRTYEEQVPREVLEELIELCKIDSISGHSSDRATKFYMHRNPHPNIEDFSPLEVEAGKIKNKYLGKVKNGVADIPGDKTFYQNAMKFMFEDSMHPDTRAILEKSILKDEVVNYRNRVLEIIGGENYFWKPRHRVRNTSMAGSDIKFLLTGIAPDELLFKTGHNVFNSKKWLKIFGKFGIGLLGFTVFAQFFLGKLKAPKGGQNA